MVETAADRAAREAARQDAVVWGEIERLGRELREGETGNQARTRTEREIGAATKQKPKHKEGMTE
jgi:hypothetical protein